MSSYQFLNVGWSLQVECLVGQKYNSENSEIGSQGRSKRMGVI